MSTETGPLIDVRDLARTFDVRRRVEGRRRRVRDQVLAVHDLTFSVDAGEMVGYIGPNGAGKSTTIKMLTGILVPTGGQVRVGGLDPSRERVELARRIGVVFGQRSTLWWDLPLRDSFDLLQKMYRITPARYRENLDRFVDLLDLGAQLDTPVRQLSLGQRMRGDITAALLHDPEVIYLDEPDDRPRRGEQGAAARVPPRAQPRARHDAAADHPRPAGHRGAVRPGDRDRPRHQRVRRLAGRAARPGRLVPHPGRRPRRRGRAHRRTRGARCARSRARASGCRSPPTRAPRRSSRRSRRRTTSRTSPSRSPTSRTSSATSTREAPEHGSRSVSPGRGAARSRARAR